MAKDPKGHGSNAKEAARARAVLAAHVAKRGDVPTEPKPSYDGHPKSDPVPEQGDGGGFQAAARSFSDKTAVMSSQKPRSDGTVGRHGYNPESVDKAINSASRHQGKVGGKERSAIHRLLRGRG